MNRQPATIPVVASAALPRPLSLLQRKCACGNHTMAGSRCDECARASGSLRRKAANEGAVGGVPPIVHDVLRSPGHTLDAATRAFMEPRFGQDFSQVRVHTDARAAEAASSIRARAFTSHSNVVFNSGEYAPQTESGRQLLSHELTHVVQQRGGAGVEHRVGDPGDAYEQHADAVAARVMRGLSAERLADRRVGSTSQGPGLQRFAFLNEKQIEKSDKSFTSEMNAMVSDDKVRDYTGLDEFKKHASKTTDYLGNLPAGTWMRFSPTGINLLGENHTTIPLEMVLPAIGSKSFIYEPFSSDVQKAGSEFQQAYQTENQQLFKTFGVEKEKNKQQFGAESLFPKIGFALTAAMPYFEGKAKMIDLDRSGYFGQPVQRYLKIAWGYSKDNKQAVAEKRKAKQKITPKSEALASIHAAVEAKLDKFITALPVDGHIEQALDKNAALLGPVAQFARAITDAAVEMAASENSSRLSDADRKALSSAKSTSDKDKIDLFGKWRNFGFEDSVSAATKRGVRYAGMGQDHLDHLLDIGLVKNQHSFEMDGKDIAAFKALTGKLAKAAKKP